MYVSMWSVYSLLESLAVLFAWGNEFLAVRLHFFFLLVQALPRYLCLCISNWNSPVQCMYDKTLCSVSLSVRLIIIPCKMSHKCQNKSASFTWFTFTFKCNQVIKPNIRFQTSGSNIRFQLSLYFKWLIICLHRAKVSVSHQWTLFLKSG